MLAASRPIARGETLSAGDMGVVAVYGPAPAGALTSSSAVVGRVAATDIAAQQLILTSALAADAAGAGLAMLVKPGLRAISLDTNDEIAVANFIRPGDRVDVQVVTRAETPGAVSQSRNLLQDVEVLAVGDSLATASGAAAKPTTASTVTLAMTPDQVSRFVLARSQGRFYLTLRNPADRGAAVDTAQGAQAVATSPTRVVRRTAGASSAIELVVEGQSDVIYPEAGGQ